MEDVISGLGYLAGATRFRRISEKLHTSGDKIYEDKGLPFKASWFSVFYSLATANAPLTVIELAEKIGFTHITVKNVVQELAKAGLVKIAVNPTDKRSKLNSLTAKGKKLLAKLKPVWTDFAQALEDLLQEGHPDFLNIINRIDAAAERLPMNKRMAAENRNHITIVDYRPNLKHWFYTLAGNWLLNVLDGKLEEEDKFTLLHPDKAYLAEGGFVFFAMSANNVIGCVALKRLEDETFEFCKLFVDKNARQGGIATKLIQRCISRCKENGAKYLWLQTTNQMREAHRLYYKLGFADNKPPQPMLVLSRTQKIMSLQLK
jgi:DNA-binding MarR family transcriptional regulator/N-acetylglutamate synthase-like GNAT family acetyltransferase